MNRNYAQNNFSIKIGVVSKGKMSIFGKDHYIKFCITTFSWLDDNLSACMHGPIPFPVRYFPRLNSRVFYSAKPKLDMQKLIMDPHQTEDADDHQIKRPVI